MININRTLKLFLLKINTQIKKLKNLGFFDVFLSTIINKILAFANAMFIVRLISKSEYGIYTYANNILSFFIVFSGLGSTSAVLQLCSETKNKKTKKTFFDFGLSFSLFFNVILGIIIIIFSKIINLPIQGSNRYLIYMSFIPFVHIVSEMFIIYFRSEIKNKEYLISNSTVSFLMLILVVIFSFFFKVKGLILAQYLAYIISSLVIYFIYNFDFSFNLINISIVELKNFFSISLVSALNNGLSRLMYLLDILVLGIVSKSNNMIASYKVATNIPTALSFIPAAIAVFIYPYFAKNKNNKYWLLKNYKKLVFGFGFFNMCLSTILIIFSSQIILIFFGRKYLDCIPIFRVLCISYFFSGTFRIISGNLLITQRELTFNFIVSIISSALNTILNYFLIQQFDSIGAAYATLITVVFSSLLSTSFLIKKFRTII